MDKIIILGAPIIAVIALLFGFTATNLILFAIFLVTWKVAVNQ